MMRCLVNLIICSHQCSETFIPQKRTLPVRNTWTQTRNFLLARHPEVPWCSSWKPHMRLRVGDLAHPVKIGAKFPFSWPGLNHSWAPFFWLLLSSFAQNSPPHFSNISLIRQKSCVTHSSWCSRGRSSGPYRNPSRAFNVFRIMVCAVSTLNCLGSVLWLRCLRRSFLNNSVQLCPSHFHSASLHFYWEKHNYSAL